MNGSQGIRENGSNAHTDAVQVLIPIQFLIFWQNHFTEQLSYFRVQKIFFNILALIMLHKPVNITSILSVWLTLNYSIINLFIAPS